jgi:carboxymethylenebutenolidase
MKVKTAPVYYWRPTIGQMVRATLKLAFNAGAKRFWKKRDVSFTSEGETIHGAIYYPSRTLKSPGVLLLPTEYGLTAHEHSLAHRLAKEGFAAMVVDAYSSESNALNDDSRRVRLERAALDALKLLQSDARVYERWTGVIGFSLGGYFATYLALTRMERPPRAAIIYYGMFARLEPDFVKLNAPLLILQGERDARDFVTSAKQAHECALRNENQCELVLLSDAGHQFDLFQPGGNSTKEAWQRTVAFLRRHLYPDAIRIVLPG